MPNSVWLVWLQGADYDDDVMGVYATREEALERVKVCRAEGYGRPLYLQEWKLGQPNSEGCEDA